MAQAKEIQAIWQAVIQGHRNWALSELHHVNCGSMAVLHYLYEVPQETTVSAGELSRHMGVSTARITVMLKKLEKDGLIVKKKEPLDARVVTVQLTEQGKDFARQKRQEIEQHIGLAIDTVGYDRLADCIATLHELGDVFFVNNKPPASTGRLS